MVELVYKFDEKSYLRMFEKVSRSLKIFFSSTNIYMDTTTDHFTTLALRVRGKYTTYIHLVLVELQTTSHFTVINC